MENARQVAAALQENLPQVTTNNPQVQYKVVYVLGGPASGKGTQCSMIAARFGYCHLSVGELLEKEVLSGSENGAVIRTFKLEGKLLPTDIVMKVLGQAMEATPTKRFLIDGFLRNQENLAAAENFMKIEPDFVLYFECSDEVMTDRLLSRNQVNAEQSIDEVFKEIEGYFSKFELKYGAESIA